MNWGDGSAPQDLGSVGREFTLQHTYTAAGKYNATVTVTDDDAGVGEDSSNTVAVQYTIVGSGVQQPINQDGTSVFRYGRTVPVKVQVSDCDGSFPSTLAPTIKLKMISGATPGWEINEPESSSVADTNGIMRFSSTDNQYIYNLATKPLPDSTATYEITITIPATGQTIIARFGLRP